MFAERSRPPAGIVLCTAAALLLAACRGEAGPEQPEVEDIGPLPAVTRVVDPDIRALIEGFYADYLATAAVDPESGVLVNAALDGAIASDERLEGGFRESLREAVEAAGPAGGGAAESWADPLLCSTEIPERIEVFAADPQGDEASAVILITLPEATIPQRATLQVRRSGGAWQIAGIACR